MVCLNLQWIYVITAANAISYSAHWLPQDMNSFLALSLLAIPCAATGLVLYGHPGTRSPLCNWAAYEVGVDVEMGDLSKNPHPFGQVPCLTDDDEDDVVVFESGAILLYLHYKTKASLSKSQSAAISSWITWANASLDPICFLETPDGKGKLISINGSSFPGAELIVYDTGLKKPNKRIDQLDKILEKQAFLTGDEFTLADVAVSSYLLYVLQFFPGVDLSRWPNMVKYMKSTCERPDYAKAFGEQTQRLLLAQLGSTSTEKKMFGMF
eukprot:scaffold7755_cov104-Cylindrotheca_fusiformis.AAC.9